MIGSNEFVLKKGNIFTRKQCEVFFDNALNSLEDITREKVIAVLQELTYNTSFYKVYDFCKKKKITIEGIEQENLLNELSIVIVLYNSLLNFDFSMFDNYEELNLEYALDYICSSIKNKENGLYEGLHSGRVYYYDSFDMARYISSFYDSVVSKANLPTPKYMDLLSEYFIKYDLEEGMMFIIAECFYETKLIYKSVNIEKIKDYIISSSSAYLARKVIEHGLNRIDRTTLESMLKIYFEIEPCNFESIEKKEEKKLETDKFIESIAIRTRAPQLYRSLLESLIETCKSTTNVTLCFSIIEHFFFSIEESQLEELVVLILKHADKYELEYFKNSRWYSTIKIQNNDLLEKENIAQKQVLSLIQK